MNKKAISDLISDLSEIRYMVQEAFNDLSPDDVRAITTTIFINADRRGLLLPDNPNLDDVVPDTMPLVSTPVKGREAVLEKFRLFVKSSKFVNSRTPIRLFANFIIDNISHYKAPEHVTNTIKLLEYTELPKDSSNLEKLVSELYCYAELRDNGETQDSAIGQIVTPF